MWGLLHLLIALSGPPRPAGRPMREHIGQKGPVLRIRAWAGERHTPNQHNGATSCAPRNDMHERAVKKNTSPTIKRRSHHTLRCAVAVEPLASVAPAQSSTGARPRDRDATPDGVAMRAGKVALKSLSTSHRAPSWPNMVRNVGATTWRL